MITDLNNVNNKSFDHFNLQSNLTKVNLFFGVNGAGKTALSGYISSNSKNSRVFDTSFIQNNILLENSNEIKGVNLIAGRENLQIKLEISILQRRISEIKISIAKNNQTKEIYKEDLFDLMNQALKKLKKIFILIVYTKSQMLKIIP